MRRHQGETHLNTGRAAKGLLEEVTLAKCEKRDQSGAERLIATRVSAVLSGSVRCEILARL